MLIILDHTITLKRGAAFLELEVFQPCEDIAAFLQDKKQGIESFKQPLQERATKEMRRLGFLDSDDNLTQKGEEVIESRGRYIRECGKYGVDFTENDSIFGNRIFRVRREEAKEGEPQLKEMKFHKSPYYILNASNQTIDIITLHKAHIEQGIPKAQAIQYRRIHELSGSGDIMQDREYINDREHNAAMDFLDKNYFAAQYQKALGSNWVEKHYRLDSIEADELIEKGHIDDIRTFRVQNLQKGSFQFQNIPIAPKEEQDAHYLLELCLMKDLEEEYHTDRDLDLKQKDYRNKLECFNGDHLANLTGKLTQKDNKQAFWHYHATRDLAPQQHFKPLAKKTITIQYNEKKSYKDIVESIAQERKVKAFIYIDSYFAKNYQIKRAEIITQCFQAQKNLIITDSRNVEVLRENGLNAESVGDKNPHDRYFILAFDDELELWSITQSDFLRFEEKADSLSGQTEGRAEGATFSNIGDKLLMFSDELQARVKAFLEA